MVLMMLMLMVVVMIVVKMMMAMMMISMLSLIILPPCRLDEKEKEVNKIKVEHEREINRLRALVREKQKAIEEMMGEKRYHLLIKTISLSSTTSHY